MTQTIKQRERVLITGTGGALGGLIAEALHRECHVIGVDRRAFESRYGHIEHHSLDLRHKSAFQLLKERKPESIIHVGVIRNPLKHRGESEAYRFNVDITTQLLRLAEELRVRKFIFLSTANLYGPSSTTSGFLAEEAPLYGACRSPEIRDLVAIDMMIQSFFWKVPSIETVILRPVHIVGPHLNNAPSRYLRLDRAPTLLGFDPILQLVHQQDVIDAICLALRKDVKGIFNITGPSQAPLSRILKACGVQPIPFLEPVLRFLLERAFRLGLSTYPPGELDHLKYACLVDGDRAKKILGYEAKISIMQIIAHLCGDSVRQKALPPAVKSISREKNLSFRIQKR